jgi:hypothetical protein
VIAARRRGEFVFANFQQTWFDFVGNDIEFIWFSTFGLAIFSVKNGAVRVSSGEDNCVISPSS